EDAFRARGLARRGSPQARGAAGGAAEDVAGVGGAPLVGRDSTTRHRPCSGTSYGTIYLQPRVRRPAAERARDGNPIPERSTYGERLLDARARPQERRGGIRQRN